MKKTILSLFIALLAVCTSFAKENKGRVKPTEADFKTESEIIAKKLNLGGDSIAKFQEIYVAYKKDMFKAMEEHKPSYKKKECTEEQIDAMNRERFAHARKMLDIRETYYKKFLTTLKPSQVEKMYRIEKRLIDRKRHEIDSRKAKKGHGGEGKSGRNHQKRYEQKD